MAAATSAGGADLANSPRVIKPDVRSLRARVLAEARELLETAAVSYVYGGRAVGEGPECEACNKCLGAFDPAPKQRLEKCPECGRCSIDCSHFSQLVFLKAGLRAPYLATSLMLELGAEPLAKNYSLIDLGTDIEAAMPGDLLVYNGHVVLLEKRESGTTGDIIHATSGREIKGPGMAIQRVRSAALQDFRGQLLRILRHESLAAPRLQSRPSPLLRPIRQGGPAFEAR
jgi:hypothetical protein